MKTYESYKDSSLEWIGEIPTEWDVIRLRYRGKSIIGITYKPDEVSDETNGTLVLRSSNVQNGKLDFKDCVYVNKKIQKSQLTKEGDILVCARNGSAHLVGKCAYIPKEWENVSFGAFMSIVRTDLDKFLFYYFNSQVFKGQKGLFATSTINQLTSNMLNNLDIPIPTTKEEQTIIVNYLDKKTAEIDQLIAEKKQLAALYQEEKTAIINQAITKGINPDAKLKDSDIEWLGDIPEHWFIKKLNWCFNTVGSGTTPKAGNQDYYFNGTHNWLLTGDLNDGEINKTTKKITDKALNDYSSLKEYGENSVVIAMYGATIGKLGVLKIPTTVNQACCVLSEPTHLNYDFTFFLLLSARQEIINMSYGGGQPNISQELLKQFKIQVPPKEEQTEIVQHIVKESATIDAKITKAEKYINLLTEYRTALISEVVTGKIKVINDD